MGFNFPTFFFSCLLTASSGMIRLSQCARITIINNCKEAIWPGITGSNSTGDGFELKPTQSSVYSAPAPAWSGRVWARTGCNFDSTGNDTCVTGGCGHSLKCNGSGQPPASIVEFSLGGGRDLDYYDVSLVDGFNLPVIVQPVAGRGKCSPAGCYDDLRPNCTAELALKSDGKTVACRSACRAFDTDQYCCRGAFSTPMTCLPTNYSMIFKQGCPAAYSYAFDDPTSILTCSAVDYIVTFCPSRNQTQCTYHDNRLVCNEAGGAAAVWKVLVMAAAAAAVGLTVML